MFLLTCDSLNLTVSEHKLRGNNVVITLETALLQGLAHDDLGLPFSVNLGGIEKVDTVIPSLLQASSCLVTSVCEPATETEDRNLKTCVAEVSEEHVLGLKPLAGLGESLVGHVDLIARMY
jgi:hypothetical protein